jgi:hypothetical protein
MLKKRQYLPARFIKEHNELSANISSYFGFMGWRGQLTRHF